jgi:hypothetical protein
MSRSESGAGPTANQLPFEFRDAGEYTLQTTFVTNKEALKSVAR